MSIEDGERWLDLLGNEHRRKLLRMLAFRPMYLEQIARFLGITPRAVLKHLDQLEKEGIVRKEEVSREYGGRKLQVYNIARRPMITLDIMSPLCHYVEDVRSSSFRRGMKSWHTIPVIESDLISSETVERESYENVRSRLSEIAKAQHEIKLLDLRRSEVVAKRNDAVQTTIGEFKDKGLGSRMMQLYLNLIARFGTTENWSVKDVINITGTGYDSARLLIDVLEKKLVAAKFCGDIEEGGRDPKWILLDIAV